MILWRTFGNYHYYHLVYFANFLCMETFLLKSAASQFIDNSEMTSNSDHFRSIRENVKISKIEYVKL